MAVVLALASVCGAVGLRDVIARRSAAVAAAAAALGGAVDLDGTSEYLSDTSSTLLNTSTQATICAWVKNNGSTNRSRGIIFSRDASAYLGLSLTASGTNRFACVVLATGGLNATFSSQNSASPGEWKFVCGVWSSVPPALLYVNGAIDTNAITFSATGTILQTDVLRIGYDDLTPTNLFPGVIDDVSVYKNRALTSAEIAELYNSGVGKPATSLSTGTNGLVRYWKLDDGLSNSASTNAYDSASGTYATGTGIGSGDWTDGIVPQ
jgi:hypothetical protein